MATDITTDRLRELAETRSAQGKVLSVFINLDPREFATPPARATEISSVLDAAARTIRDAEDLTQDERTALESDLERVRSAMRDGFDAKEARALAVFASEPAGLFEILKLPRAVDHKVAISETPCVEPLARIGTGELWWIVLVDRKHARLLAGTIDGLVELWRHEDDLLGRVDSERHDQDGRSEKRYERGVEKEVDVHLRGDVAKCLKGHVDVDVWNSGADAVLAAARPVLDDLVARRDDELLAKIDEGLGKGDRAVSGLGDVLTAVHERRLDTLVIQEGFTAKGTRCPQCGWLGVSAGGQCPADGTMTDVVDNIVETAVGRAFGQDARVRYLAVDNEAIELKGSIAALLRF
jgi:peptide chain release factor subunit 1